MLCQQCKPLSIRFLGFLRVASSSLNHVKSQLEQIMASLADFKFQRLAVPAVCLLICFLAYSSQILFLGLDPAPLTKGELLKFNVAVCCIWICYYRACATEPGYARQARGHDLQPSEKERDDESLETDLARNRWCRKCDCAKPPRAHHCRTCGRYVAIMFQLGAESDASQMYSQDGPPLSLDKQLRFSFHLSTLYSLPRLLRLVHVPSRILLVHPLRCVVGEAVNA